MYQILSKAKLADKIFEMVVRAPRVAHKCLPGQFIIAKIDETGERIPLTICDYDREEGTITIVFQTVGASTERMSFLEAGEAFEDFIGPLGRPSVLCLEENLDKTREKKIVFICGGVGTAPIYPQVKWLKEHGIPATVIMGSRNKDLLFYVDNMKEVAEHLYVCTDDGSYGFHGMGTNQLQALWDQGDRFDHCVAIGPMIMMKFVCKLTAELGIHTEVSMNPIMVDGTGMCGACRLEMKLSLPVWTGPSLTATRWTGMRLWCASSSIRRQRAGPCLPLRKARHITAAAAIAEVTDNGTGYDGKSADRRAGAGGSR